MDIKSIGEKKIYNFCFHFEESKVWDERVTVPTLSNSLADYSDFLDAWHLRESYS
jgi:hypothetical protein